MNKCFRCKKEFSSLFDIYDLCVCDFGDKNDYANTLSHTYPVCKECKKKAVNLFEEFMEQEVGDDN